jgi:hypothetical protein
VAARIMIAGQLNINKSAKHYIHILKQDFRISLGFYRIYDYYIRHKNRMEGQELDPFGSGRSLCRW